MSAVEETLFPSTVSSERAEDLRQAVSGFDREQLIWSSGYLAGLAQRAPARAPAPPPAAAQPAPTATEAWSVYYATETGNSARIANRLAEQVREAGHAVGIHDLREVRPRSLAKVRRAVFVLATHGVGEAPEGSEEFFDYWQSTNAPRLAGLLFGVIALGDSSYADFCAVGRRFEARLVELGATTVRERLDCDLDYEKPAARWTDEFVARLDKEPAVAAVSRAVPGAAVSEHGRGNPFPAAILANQKITGRDSSKDVRHIELDLEGSGLRYLPGDSLGVRSVNPPELVEAVLGQTGLDGDSDVDIDGRRLRLAEALANEKEVTLLCRPILEAVAADHDALQSIIASRANLANYLSTRQVIDLLAEFPCDWNAQSLVDALRGLTPRLYSIASSPDANPGEAHLTVGVVRYRKFGRPHWGGASNYLAGGEQPVPVYVEPNDRFRLPADGDTPVIMIGAGTGVAPYRAFVEHRGVHGYRGRNWLVFGDRSMASDFLYQLEWLRYRRDGLLTRLDVAFSRDQADKVYVQHRLHDHAADLYRWLEDGAHLYVCGDAHGMAVDVDRALRDIVGREGGMTAEGSAAYLAALKKSGRYQRDVY